MKKVKAPEGNFEFITGGKEYEIRMGLGHDPKKGRIFVIKCDDGAHIDCNEKNSVWLDGKDWIIL
ncbi:MAG: hypothetical protein ACO1N0_15380 [Fluviicola sp.]